jgi:hypothetical protein
MNARPLALRASVPLSCLFLVFLGFQASGVSAGEAILALQDHLNHQWTDELVHFRVTFRERNCGLDGIYVVEKGVNRPVRYQVSAVEYWSERKKLVKACTVSIRTDLGPLERKEYLVRYRATAATDAAAGGRVTDRPAGPESDIREEASVGSIVVSNSKFGVRLFQGERTCRSSGQEQELAAPILSVRKGDGPWLGQRALTGHILPWRASGVRGDSGPLFNDYQFDYRFGDGSSYRMKLRFLAGQDYLLVEEDTSAGGEAAFVYTFAEEGPLTPPDRLWIHSSGGTGASRTLTYEQDMRHGRLTCFSQYRQLFDFVDWLGVHWSEEAVSKRGEMVGFVALGGGDWTRCALNVISAHERKNGQFEMNFPLVGHRKWAMVVTDRTHGTAMRNRGEPTSYLNDLHTKLSYCPLDEIKGMALDWQPVSPSKRPLMSPPPLHSDKPARLPGKAEFLTTSSWSLLGLEDLTLDLGLMASPFWPSMCIRSIPGFCRNYDALAAKGELSQQEDKVARAALAFLAYKLYDADYYPWHTAFLPDNDPESLEPLYRGMLNVNFNTDRYNAVASVALCFPCHPMSETWLKHFQSQVDHQYRKFVYECGAWAEGPSYEDYVKKTLFETFRVLKWRGIRNYFAEPRWWKYWEYPIHTFTPYDPRYHARTNPSMGDHGGRQSVELFHGLARELAGIEPELSRKLGWAWQEYGGKPGEQFVSVPAEAQTLTSRELPGIGCTMRANFGTDDETMIMFRVGKAWEHRHDEQGSFHIYAYGSPLAVDAGDGAGPLKLVHRGHNVIRLDNKDAFQVFNLPNAQGRMTCFRSTPVADLAVAEIPVTWYAHNSPTMGWMDPQPYEKPSRHTRHLLFLKPDCLVVHDTVASPYASEWLMHVICDKVEVQGDRIHFDGSYQHDLEAFFLEPSPLSAQVVESDGHAKTRGVAISNLPGKSYVSVLQIRRKGAPRFSVRQLEEGPVFEVRREGGTDTVFAAPEGLTYSDGQIQFKGRFGVIRRSGKTVTLCLLAGEQLACHGKGLSKEGGTRSFETEPPK